MDTDHSAPRPRKNRRLELEEEYLDIEKRKLAALERRNELEEERQKADAEALQVQKRILAELVSRNQRDEQRDQAKSRSLENVENIEYLEDID